jgi:hypothetical protein
MSDSGLKSFEYQRASDLADKLTRMRGQLAHATGGADLAALAQTRLQVALEHQPILEHLTPLDAGALDSGAALNVPPAMLARLRKDQLHGRPVAEALETSVARLKDTSQQIEHDDLEVVERVSLAAEAERSDAFDRIIRR